MNVAITGASGLLGSHLSNYLTNLGYEVFVLIKDESANSILSPKVNRIYGNINFKQDLDYFVQRSIPEYFIHLAAQTQAYDSLKYPYNTFSTNFVGTLNVLETLREYDKCRSIVIASSDKAYGELIGNEYLENHPLNGVYPYDASKAATEVVTISYKRTYNLPIVITRSCNIYGINDTNQERLITGILHAYVANKEFIVRNAGLVIREYINVSDVVTAYVEIMKFAEKDSSIDAFNISSGDRFSTLEVFELVQSAVGKKIRHLIQKESNKEIRKQFMNSDLLKQKTSWIPKAEFKNSIKDIVSWYLQTYQKMTN